MSDQPPPRVRVTLPGDVPGTLHGWRQDKTGRWWAVVTVYAPAAAVQQVAGEDYSGVPREPAPTPESRYVLATDTRLTPPAMELHQAGCLAIAQPARWRRITPVAATDARGMLRFDDTTPCDVCHPEP